MGYYSEVAIQIEFESVETKRRILEEFKALELQADKFYTRNRLVFYWNSIKWYESYRDVAEVENLVKKLGEECEEEGSDITSVQFLRIGEDDGDTERKEFGEVYNYLWVRREIEFEGIKYDDLDDLD